MLYPFASLRRFVAIVAVGAIAIGVTLTGQTPTKRIALIAGRPSHPPGMHEFRAGAMLLQKALGGVPGVTVQVYTNGWPSKMVDGMPVDDNAALDGADAVVIYSDGGGGHPALARDHMKVIDALAAKGVGLGFAHYGVEVPAGQPGAAMHRWAGGYYEENFSVNPMWAPAFATFPNHPVTRGVKPFGNRDEWYFNMRWTPDQTAMSRVTPILTAVPGDDVRKGPYVNPPGPYPHIIAASGRTETMMWVYERPDGGRSFGFTGGHTHANWGDVNQRRVVLNALLWIAKVDVPAGGVVDTISPADLLVNLDQKPR
ncbi:MAG: ThuA domain-containing protein [Vicinamibacterales bacterium]